MTYYVSNILLLLRLRCPIVVQIAVSDTFLKVHNLLNFCDRRMHNCLLVPLGTCRGLCEDEVQLFVKDRARRRFLKGKIYSWKYLFGNLDEGWCTIVFRVDDLSFAKEEVIFSGNNNRKFFFLPSRHNNGTSRIMILQRDDLFNLTKCVHSRELKNSN